MTHKIPVCCAAYLDAGAGTGVIKEFECEH